MQKTERKNVATIIWLIIGISLAIHLLSFIVGKTLLENWHWVNEPFHSSVEMSGSVIALLVAAILIIFERANRGTHFNSQIAAALIVMGLLDGFHAIVHVGDSFVWLHSIATFTGGIFFIIIWVPKRWEFFRSVWWPLIALIVALCIGICTLLFPDILPTMVQNGRFTLTARLINLSGGILLFASAFRLVQEYFHTRSTDDLLFCLHCSLFGAASIMFEQSNLWDVPWWGWHLLRLMAYLVAILFVIQSERKMLSDYLKDITERRELEEELRKHHDQLQELVNERTAEITKTNEKLRDEITERKIVEVELVRSRQKSLLHTQRTPLAVIEWSTNFEVTEWNPAAEKIFGYKKEEALGHHAEFIIHENAKEHVDKVWKGLLAQKGGKRSTNENINKDGNTIYCEWYNTPLIAESGEVLGVASLVQDVTDVKLAENEIRVKNSFLKILQIAAVAANEATEIKNAFQPILNKICDYTGWPIGHAYIISKDDPNLLESTTVWQLKDSRHFAGFRNVTEMTKFAKGIGLPGRVLASGKPLWIVDVARDNNFPRSGIAKDMNIKSAFAFPVMVVTKVVAVLEFFSTEVAEPNQQFLDIMADVGTQLGRVVERKSIEKELTELNQTLEERVANRTAELSQINKTLVQEVSERKMAEERLMNSEKKSRAWLENSPACTKMVDLDFNLQYMSAAGIKGLKIDDITQLYGKPYPFDFYPESFRNCMTKNLEKVKETGEMITQEASVVDIEGNELWFHSTLVPVNDDEGRIDYIIIVSIDTTERKQAEEALHESEEKYRTLFEGSADAMLIIEGDNFVDCNPAAVKMLEYKNKKEVLNTHPFQLSAPLQPDGQDSFEKANQMMAIAFDQGSNRFEWYHQRKNGEVFPVEVLLTSIPFKGKKSLHVAWRDIEERKQAEEAVMKSEQQFRTLVSNIPGIVYRCENDEHWTMRYLSNSIEDLTGYTTSDFIGNNVRSFTSIIHHKDREMVDRIVQEGVRNNQPFVIECRIVSKDGSIRYVSMKGQGVFNKEGELLWLDGAIFDITEQRAIETELIKVQKLESVGVLAGGIAHDFNNSLQAILGYITLAELHASSNNGIQEYLEEARKAVLQSSGLTQQLLTFSKGGAPVKSTLSISELLRDSVRLALSGSSLKCDYDIPDDLWLVEADKGQMNQVFSNLVINAVQAMPGGGVIKIYAENIDVVDKDLLPLQKGRYVKVSVEDHGIGISQEHLQKIFDPYFTTKQKGNGLGLATTFSIIKKHDGHITVESEIGVGTTFRIYLPASRKEIREISASGEVKRASTVPVDKKDDEKPNVSKGKVLLMDDEYVIRVALGKHLKHLNYVVEAVEDGSEAIRLYKNASEAGKPFDAVVMDLTISGGMGGKETIKKLLEIDPEAKAVVMSGYANDPIMANYKEHGFKGVLPKPHDIHELDETLQNLMMEKLKSGTHK